MELFFVFKDKSEGNVNTVASNCVSNASVIRSSVIGSSSTTATENTTLPLFVRSLAVNITTT